MSPRRLLAFSTAAVVGLLVACMGTMVYRDHAQSRDKVIAEAAQLTLSIAQQTTAGTDKARLILEQVAADFPFIAVDAQAAYAARLSRIAQANREIELVGLLDAHGTPIGKPPDALPTGAPYLPADEFERQRRQAADEVIAGAPFSHPVTHRMILPLAKRIISTDGHFLGVAVVGVSIDYLQAKFAKIRRDGDSRILLVDEAGNVVARHPVDTGPINADAHTGRSVLADHIARHEAGHIDAPSPFDGIVRSYAFRHIDGTQLTVVFGESTDTQLAGWRDRTRGRLGYLVLVLIVIGLAAYYIDLLIRRDRATQAALNESLARASGLELALHQHAMISRTDMHDRIVGVNDRFCEISGYERDELIGKTHRILNSGEHPPEFFAELHQTIRAGKVWTGDICNKTKAGDFFWSRSTIVPFRNASGEIYQYVALRTDISELKFMQRQVEIASESIAASFDLLYATVNSSASGIITTDKDGLIVMMNAAAEAMLGHSQQDAEGLLSMLDLHDPAQVTGAILAAEGKLDIDLHEVSYAALAAAVAASPEREWVYRTAAGAELPISLTIAPLTDQYGELQGYVTSFNDLTRLKQVEVMKSDFVSMVSHELRTPLTSIKGSLTLLDKMAGSAMPANQRKLLDIGVHNCEALVNLVSDILDFEKISRNAMSYDMRAHDVRTLIEQAVAATQPYAAQFNVSYWLDRDDHELPVLADAQRFEQIMRNLLSNAAKFSHPGSEVLVSAHADGGIVTISVADKGVGIPADFQPKIFQKFSQVSHSDRPTKIKGTGLGLAIAKMMTEAHGGTIGFTSSEGVGTTFFIKLPLRLGHPALMDEGIGQGD